MSLHKKDKFGFAFMDDTDLCISGPDKVGGIMVKMQQSVTHWEGLLWATRGALVSDKCF